MVRAASTSREMIVEAAREIARQSGLGAVTISAVAARCGVSEGTIYNYVDGKAELMRLCAGESEDPIQFFDRLRHDGKVDAESWLPAVATNMLESLRHWMPLMMLRIASIGTETAAPDRPREAVDALTRLIRDLEGGSEERARGRAFALMGLCFNRVFGEVTFSSPFDERDDAAFLRDLHELFHGHPEEASS